MNSEMNMKENFIMLITFGDNDFWQSYQILGEMLNKHLIYNYENFSDDAIIKELNDRVSYTLLGIYCMYSHYYSLEQTLKNDYILEYFKNMTKIYIGAEAKSIKNKIDCDELAENYVYINSFNNEVNHLAAW